MSECAAARQHFRQRRGLAARVRLNGRGAYGFAALWTVANLVTNLWPILLQRYNRARAERVSLGRSDAT